MQVEQQRIAISTTDGRVFIMSYVTLEASSLRLVRYPNTDEAIAAEIDRCRQIWRESLGAEVASWKRVADNEIPDALMKRPNGRYRGAWTYDGKTFKVDMAKAREEHRAILRRERAPMLDQLDRDWMRAAGQKKQADADAIEGRRQRLRDAPAALAPAIEAATSLEELKAITLPE